MSDIQTFGTTAATHPREESATQRESVAETTHPCEESQLTHEESQPTHEELRLTAKKGAKQLKSTQQRRLMFAKELKLRYEDVEYNEERGMVSVKCPDCLVSLRSAMIGR